MVGVVTDNTSSNKNAWKIMERDIPGFFATGCVAHGLHLLVRDVFDVKETVETPLKYLGRFVNDCKNVTKVFQTRHIPNMNSYPTFDAEGKMQVLTQEEQRARQLAIYKELDGFSGKCATKKRGDARLDMLLSGDMHPRDWWFGKMSTFPEIAPIAVRVFTMTASSASSERGFSADGFIHKSTRNRLSDDKVSKLVFIKFNAPKLTCYTAEMEDEEDVMDAQVEFSNAHDSDVELIG
jgi:hypothetical protein